MGVYLFSREVLDPVLWQDHENHASSHDFGKDILPAMITAGYSVYTFPFSGYWVDVGTVDSYWSAHMDLLKEKPSIDLNDRSWVIHTRTEERPPVSIAGGANIIDSMITDGCVISSGAYIERSILAPGVRVKPGAKIVESIVLTNTVIEKGAEINRAIIDKQATIGESAKVGVRKADRPLKVTMIGKNSIIPPNQIIETGGVIATDVIETDFPSNYTRCEDYIQTKRLPYEV